MSTAGALGAGGGGAGATGAAGGDGKPFYDGFQNAEVKALMQAKNYADPEALGLAYHNLNKLHNGAKDVIAVPGDKATDEDWGKVHAALGRPESADKYELKFPDGTKTDESFVKFAKGLFFEMGLSPKMAQKAAEKWQEFVGVRTTEIATADTAAATKKIEELKTSWGKEWDVNVAAGQKAIKALNLSVPELNELDKHMGSPAVLKLLAAVGKGIGKEDTTIVDPSQPAGLKGVDTPEQARAEIAKLQTDNDFQNAMRDTKNQAKREAAVKLWGALHEKAYPPVARA